MDDDLAFLDANFDLQSLTKPQLRGILSVHAPERIPPTSAKKDELVDAVEAHVRSRAKSILSAKKKVKPSVAGITFLDEESRPSPGSRRALTGRSRSKSRSSSPGKSPSRRFKKSVDAIKDEDDKQGTGMQASNSSGTPSGHKQTKQVFESPLATLKLPSYQDTPRTATQKMSVRFAQMQTEAGATIEELPSKFYVDWAPVFSFFKEVLKISSVLLATIMIGFFIRWKHLHPFPYCSERQSPRSLTEILFDPLNAVSIINSYCVQCPRHGRCSNGKLQCLDGFVKRANWGVGHCCIPDRKQLEQVDRLGKSVMNVLSDRAGLAVCEGADPRINESDLKARLNDLVSIPKFDHIFKLAIDDLLKEGGDMRVRRTEDQGRLFESLRPNIPIGCRIRLSIWGFIDRNKHSIGVTLSLLLVTAFSYFRIMSNRRSRARTRELVDSVFRLLAEQAAAHRRDPLTPATVIVEQLRDALFLKHPEDIPLWPRVCAAVANNSNVREQSLLSHGQYTLSWEWIGMDIFASTGNTLRSPYNLPAKPGVDIIKRVQQDTAGLYPSFKLS